MANTIKLFTMNGGVIYEQPDTVKKVSKHLSRRKAFRPPAPKGQGGNSKQSSGAKR